jgi:hypothetical protein
MSPSETELHRSFLRRFTAHEPALRAYIHRQVPARADANDIMQEVVARLADEALDNEPRLAHQRAALEFRIEKVAPDQRQRLMLVAGALLLA